MKHYPRRYIKTGDVIAFSGNGFLSTAIKLGTHSRYSHVGIVVEANGRVLMMESTTLVTLRDEKTKEFIKGVQTHYLSDLIKVYSGRAYWLPIRENVRKNIEPLKLGAMRAWLNYKHAKRTPYDDQQVLNAGIDILDLKIFENDPDFSKLFCSEMVAKALQIAGLIPREINPSEETPADIANYQIFSDAVKLSI